MCVFFYQGVSSKPNLHLSKDLCQALLRTLIMFTELLCMREIEMQPKCLLHSYIPLILAPLNVPGKNYKHSVHCFSFPLQLSCVNSDHHSRFSSHSSRI